MTIDSTSGTSLEVAVDRHGGTFARGKSTLVGNPFNERSRLTTIPLATGQLLDLCIALFSALYLARPTKLIELRSARE
jgi:hypothetical protein